MNQNKKACLNLIAVALVAGSAIFGWQKTNSQIEEGILSENIEALTQTESIKGRWIVTVFTPSHWECKPNGGLCCPLVDC